MTTHSDFDNGTKGVLLDCALKLFLAKGFEAVSVREITEAAGANVAAINYHFNSKTELYRACLERLFTCFARRKVALLADISQQENASLRQVIAAYVHSTLSDFLDKDSLLQMIYREMGPDAVANDLVTELLILPIHRALAEAIHRLCPELPEKHLARCISSLAGQILHFVRFRETINLLVHIDAPAGYLDEVTSHITEFTLRGIGSNRHG